MTFAPRKRGRPTGSRKVHPDRDKLIHFEGGPESVISQTGLGVVAWREQPGTYRRLHRGDLDLIRWPESALITCAGSEQGKIPGKISRVAAPDGNPQAPHLEQAGDRDQLVRQLLGVDHLTVRHAYRRVQAAQPWRASVREDGRRAERTRRALAGEPIDDAPFMTEDDPP